MRKGILNKPELARVARAFRDLDAMQADIPAKAEDRNRDEDATLTILVDARNRLGELIRWQDYPTWQEIDKNRA